MPAAACLPLLACRCLPAVLFFSERQRAGHQEREHGCELRRGQEHRDAHTPRGPNWQVSKQYVLVLASNNARVQNSGGCLGNVFWMSGLFAAVFSFVLRLSTPRQLLPQYSTAAVTRGSFSTVICHRGNLAVYFTVFDHHGNLIPQ